MVEKSTHVVVVKVLQIQEISALQHSMACMQGSVLWVASVLLARSAKKSQVSQGA